MKLFIFLLCAGASAQAELPVVTLRTDDTEIRQSCRLEIPPGTDLADANGDGVVHVAASDIVIELAPNSVLRGAPADMPPDQYRGYAIRIQGQRNVTVRGGQISGYHGALWATACDGLTLEDIDASDNRRAHLKSDPQLEDSGDWLYPHHNDDNHWLNDYAAALYIEDSRGITVRHCRVHHGQNALCLDRVNEARVYDNDFSFNSGWGIALWRSSRNIISRNACDFCIRGYSHNVYNRGQDSAGFLVFEQCSDNVIAENSATHGGDALFGYAGREGQGEVPPDTQPATTQPAAVPFSRPGIGCDRNLLIRNDFSYAAAHGIEMTFSFGNRYLANRLVGNAICGIWNGYSQDTLIAGNEIAENGEMGYGLERGGINIDSSRRNRIVHNTFRDNRCGVHLWWAPQDKLEGWAARNCPDWNDNLIADNTFTGDVLAFHFRGPGKVTLAANKLTSVRREENIEDTTQVTRDDDTTVPPADLPTYPVLGDTRPVGARPQLRGRAHIIMTEWGPWDHASPLVRRIESPATGHTYALWCLPTEPKVTLRGDGVSGQLAPATGPNPGHTYTVSAAKPGVYAYELAIAAGEFRQTVRGTLVATTWKVTEFPWTTSPQNDVAGWRREAQGPDAQTGELKTLWIFRSPDPLDIAKSSPRAAAASAPAGDRPRRGTRPRTHAGLIARTKLPMPAGTWRFALVGNGGIRLQADGEAIINDWARSWIPRRSVGVLKLSAPREVELVVEQQRDQLYMALALEITPGE